MDKNTIIGFILIVALLIGFSMYSQKQQAEINAYNDSVAQVEAAKEAKVAKAQAAADTVRKDSVKVAVDSVATGLFVNDSTAKDVVLQNGKVAVTIAAKGGCVSRVTLKEFKSYKDYAAQKDAQLTLFDDSTSQMAFTFETKESSFTTKDWHFTPVAQSDSSVTMRLTAQNGGTLDMTYTLLPDNYMVNLTVQANGLQSLFPAKMKTFGIDWTDDVKQQEKGYYFENMYSVLTYKTDDDTEKMQEQKDDSQKPELPVNWVAFKNQYFSAVLIAPKSLTNTELTSKMAVEGSGFIKSYNLQGEAEFDASGAKPTQLQFYFGPNNYRLLQSMEQYKLGDKELDLQELVYLGWPIVRWINRFFTLYVFDFLTAIKTPMWLVLVLITLLLRVIVFVPTKKSFMSSAKMRVLKPKIDEINAKYPNKEDAMKRQQETMQLYSQYGASPMGGCLPMLIQMPIWIAMFNFVPNAIEMRQESFLWAEDLSAYDSVISWGTHIWAIGDHLSLFCLLFCGTNILYSVMTMRQQRDTMSGEQAQQMKMMQWMMYLMPLIFFFMFNKYSAGLNFYYFISLLFSAVTMWWLRRTTDDEKLLAKLETYYKENKNNPKKKTSGLAARLEALQKEQEARLAEQRKKNNK